MLGQYEWRLSVLIGLYFACPSQGWQPVFECGNKYGIMFICKSSDERGSASAGPQGACFSTSDDRWVWSVCGMYLVGESHRETCSNTSLCPAFSPWPAKDLIRVSVVKFRTNQRPKLCHVHHELSDSFVLLSTLPYTVDKKASRYSPGPVQCSW